MSISPCDLPLDIFYKLIEDYNDPSKALELIEVCDKMEDFMSDFIRRKQFLKYYRPIILDLEYDDLMTLFDKNPELFNNFRNDQEFWQDKMNKEGGSIIFLIHSASQGHIEYVRKIIGYDFSTGNEEYCGALILAAKNDHIEIVKLITNNKSISQECINTAFDIAYNNKSFGVLKFLLSFNKITKQRIEYIRNKAVDDGNARIIKLLMSRFSFGDNILFDMLFSAVMGDKIEVVNVILQHKDFNSSEIIMTILNSKSDYMFDLLMEDKRILHSLITYSKENKQIKEGLLKFIKNEGLIGPKSSWSIRDIGIFYANSRRKTYPLPKYLKTKKQKDLYEYWKSQLNERKHAFNKYYLRDDTNEFLPNEWEISFNLKEGVNLNDFLKKYKMEIRGILQVKKKEMRVIFQAYHGSAVSIIHIREL